MSKPRFVATPRIFWEKGKTKICKQTDGTFLLCLEDNDVLVNTGIKSKNLNELIKKAEVQYGDVA